MWSCFLPDTSLKPGFLPRICSSCRNVYYKPSAGAGCFFFFPPTGGGKGGGVTGIGKKTKLEKTKTLGIFWAHFFLQGVGRDANSRIVSSLTGG